jgi:hypothetical protein
MKTNIPQSIIYYGTDTELINKIAFEFAFNIFSRKPSLAEIDIRKHMTNNTYPDFLKVAKKEEKAEILIEDSRNILEFLSQRSSFGWYRAIIIEEVDLFSINAANSILKILEEPPEKTCFILTTSRLHSVPPTIRSRCHKVFVNNRKKSAACFENAEGYIKHCLRGNDSLIEEWCSFFEKDGGDIVGFSKGLEAHHTLFSEFCLLYLNFLLIQTLDPILAEKFLRLQEFVTEARKSHLDPKVFALACMTHL